MGIMKNIIYGANIVAKPLEMLIKSPAKNAVVGLDLVPNVPIRLTESFGDYFNMGSPVSAGINIVADIAKYAIPEVESTRAYSYSKLITGAYGVVRCGASLVNLYSAINHGENWIEPVLDFTLNAGLAYHALRDAKAADELRETDGKNTFADDFHLR